MNYPCCSTLQNVKGFCVEEQVNIKGTCVFDVSVKTLVCRSVFETQGCVV